MSKKKNTLKDLDDFLKQQAATLVAPTQLSDTIQEPAPEVQSPVAKKEKLQEPDEAQILDDLKILAEKQGPSFRKTLYDLIIKSTERQKNPTAEDKMLINTALYLKGGDQWKETIRSYWKNKPA